MIKLNGISKKYENKEALTNLDLILPSKGLVIISGKKESGKTTLINILAALDYPDSGELYFQDKILNKSNHKQLDEYRAHNIGFIFQKYIQIRGSIRENLLITSDILNQQFTDQELEEVLSKVSLDKHLNEISHFLTSGEMMKLNIAQALLKNPEIILSDEPTFALNNQETIEILNILKNISKDHLILITLDDEELARKYADRFILLEDGRIAYDSNPSIQMDLITETKKPRKTGLRFKNNFLAAINNIRNSPFRIILLIFLTFFFFSYLFMAKALTGFDGPALILDTMEYNEIDYGQIYKNGPYYYGRLSFTKADVDTIIEKNPNFDYYKILNDSCSLYLVDCKGMVEIPEKEKFNFIHGKYPKNHNEFFVTKTYAELLVARYKFYGYDINDISELIGHHIDDLNYTLVGITDHDYLDNYLHFKPGFLNTLGNNEENQPYCSFLYFKTSKNYQDNYRLIQMYYGDDYFYIDYENKFFFENPVTLIFYPDLAIYHTMAERYTSYYRVLFVIIIFLSTLNAIYFINTNRRLNWIKRVHGYRNKDLILTYIIQIAIPILVILPISIISGIGGIEGLEKEFYYQIKYNMYTLPIQSFIKVILTSFLIIFITSLVPIIKFTKAYPLRLLRISKRKKQKNNLLDVRFLD